MMDAQSGALTALTGDEARLLAEHEAVIERGQKAFLEVGRALVAIREGRLYRATHRAFEVYCRERWGMSKTHANRNIGAAQVVADLTPNGIIPSVESQVRELAPVPAEDRPKVWQAAVERAQEKGRAVTARDVKEAREEQERLAERERLMAEYAERHRQLNSMTEAERERAMSEEVRRSNEAAEAERLEHVRRQNALVERWRQEIRTQLDEVFVKRLILAIAEDHGLSMEV